MIYAETILNVARKYIGVEEHPFGSNSGPTVSKFQSVTGAYHAPWCASALQYWLRESGYGTIADRSAGAYYIGNWCRQRGWQVHSPQPADIVVFFHGTGHIGIVESTNQIGFYSIEGNSSNGVRRNYHSMFTACAFYRLSNVKPRPRVQWLPRFEVVGSDKGHEVVYLRWNKWVKVAGKVPGVLAKHKTARIKRKLVKTLV